ncbi:hypothetical protein ABZY81_35370 [Streptomyces sp. NPDC006514]|uniref:hypothetical protein n=1 Tax=Streptomyces sp. NPDC006514 TaxID=3154308 RepID=UPI0033A53CCD
MIDRETVRGRWPRRARETISIWAAARLAGEDPLFSSSLAFALNARGTIGIVLAGVTRQADLIDDRFFAVLVLVSLVTCQIAGHRLAKAADRLMTATVTGAPPRLRGTGAGR